MRSAIHLRRALASRMAWLAVVAATATGCGFGFGTPYPGVPTRVRYDDNWALVERGSGRVVGRTSVRDTYGGGAWGGTVGVSLGPGELRLGDRAESTDMDAGARVEVAHAFGPKLGLAVSGGVLAGSAEFAEEGLSKPMTLHALSLPLEIVGLWTPTFPFLLHAGLAGDPYRLTLTRNDKEIERSGLGLHAFGGLGISFFFGGVAFLVQGEWRWRSLGRHDFGAVQGDVRGTSTLVRLVMVM